MKVIPAEWEKQRCILMSFPHEETDWADSLNEALSPFIRIAQAIAYKQAVYIVCKDKKRIASLFCSTRNMTFIEIATNDTWIRDYGCLSLRENNHITLLDFTFDGWGGKFESALDNRVNQHLHTKGYLGTNTLKSIDFVLEGGSIESDGQGTILTTTQCLCNPNRNGGLSKTDIEIKLKKYLGAKRILWLDNGCLIGDDTDAHIDTLVRFVKQDTLVYVSCDNPKDAHYNDLQKMLTQLKTFTTLEGKPYKLIALPMTEAIYNSKKQRLPATYANFLITNEALIYPTYSDKHDKIVHKIFEALFPHREIIPVNCLKLIEQGGSLHCSTMQIAY